MWRAGLALTVTLVSLGASPGVSLAQTAPPGPPVGQNNLVDCDVFPNGVHEVPIIVVTSPAAGATVPPGDLTIQGIAVDCHVEVGAGINRVAVYLGSREAGGTYLGDAALRQPNPLPVLPADQYQGVSGWVFKTNVPLKPGQLNDLFIYARSEMTNRETSVRLPLMGAGTAAAQPAATATPAAASGAEPAAAPTAAPDAASAAAPDTASAPAPEAAPPDQPLASNAPPEATVPHTEEPMPDEDEPPPPPPVEDAPVE